MRLLSLCLALAILVARAPSALADVDTGTDPWAAVPAVLETPPEPSEPEHHRGLALAGLGGIYAGFSIWAWFAWYHNHPPNQDFEIGGDGGFERNAYAGGSDKLGHAWATMVLSRMSTQVLKLGGWNPVPAALIGSGLASGLFTLVEYADAFYYVFSLGDLLADVLGSAVSAALESSERADELFDFRVEYFPSEEYRAIVRGDDGYKDPDIKALNIAEDYSGQKYLAAVHLGAFDQIEKSKWTKPLRYVDAFLGFQSNNYRPHPRVPTPDGVGEDDQTQIPKQHVTIGLSLNLQNVFDDLISKKGGTAKRITRKLLHGWTELMNAPFTSYGIGPSRSCDDPAGMRCELGH